MTFASFQKSEPRAAGPAGGASSSESPLPAALPQRRRARTYPASSLQSAKRFPVFFSLSLEDVRACVREAPCLDFSENDPGGLLRVTHRPSGSAGDRGTQLRTHSLSSEPAVPSGSSQFSSGSEAFVQNCPFEDRGSPAHPPPSRPPSTVPGIGGLLLGRRLLWDWPPGTCGLSWLNCGGCGGGGSGQVRGTQSPSLPWQVAKVAAPQGERGCPLCSAHQSPASTWRGAGDLGSRCWLGGSLTVRSPDKAEARSGMRPFLGHVPHVPAGSPERHLSLSLLLP